MQESFSHKRGERFLHCYNPNNVKSRKGCLLHDTNGDEDYDLEVTVAAVKEVKRQKLLAARP